MSNPYLPNWEYIPDGEPKVFGNRVYIAGNYIALYATGHGSKCTSLARFDWFEYKEVISIG